MIEEKEKKSRFRRKKKKDDEMLRIEELEKLMADTGGEVDPDTLISMYMPHRKRKLFAAALLRMDKLSLWLLGLLLAVAVLFIAAFMQEKMGNFTINLDRLELFRKGIAIADEGYFEKPTARLTANTVTDATNISIDDIPEDVDQIDGGHNGDNYMAYTYYVRNAGKEDVYYEASITLDSCAKGAEEAVRVAVWRNGERTVYAWPSADGTPEDGCENFVDEKTVCRFREEDFLVGNVDKYTIVIWMEGDDPECVDRIVGGSVEFSMHISADNDDESSLLWKFVKDIVDTLKSDKPISAAGNDAPDYYKDRDVNWYNRRNGGATEPTQP
ncbi:MAG: hypothetical protein MR762_06330 [Clostridiales bacterium]|nr:hypothetical protein [Clostridiales bacterium]MDD5882712.1 hypothetical protein [Bacillota bacterium]